jgi:sigma-B regulation protein RsbU (phosphoserine phosphatase)
MEESREPNINPIKILSVDDEPDMQELLKQKFRRKIKSGEYEFYFASNGQEALNKLDEHNDIDFVLCDINMPVMDGLTFLGKAHEVRNSILKTIMVTAYGDIDNIRKAMNNGAFDFLNKPINFDDLEITMQKTLEQITKEKAAVVNQEQLFSIQKDLQVAKNIQLSLLPRSFPPYPNRKEIDIFATIDAAKVVGGDFYDFYFIDNEHLGFVMGDVSGKGISGAIFMAMTRTIIRTISKTGLTASKCMFDSNNLVCVESLDSMFVTVFYGILNVKTGEIEYANAGHCPPYILRNDGRLEKIPSSGNIVLGIMEDMPYKSNKIKLNKGEIIYIFTDGVPEAMNIRDELFSEKRLENLLSSLNSKSVEEICRTVVNHVKEFAGNAEQSDDITTLAIQFNG